MTATKGKPRRDAGDGSLRPHTNNPKARPEKPWLARLTISSYKDESGAWKQNRETKVFPTKAEAKSWLDARRHELGLVPDDEPSAKDTENQTLRQWLDECFTQRWYGVKAEPRERTKQKYHENITLYVPKHILDTPLRSLTTKMLAAMFKELQPKVSYHTASYTYRLLRARLNDAVTARRLAHNPIAGVRLNPATFKKSSTARHVLTDDEAARFEAAAWKDRFGPLWILLLNTGLRPSEALALTWDCWQDDTLTVKHSLARVRESAPSWRKANDAEKAARERWKWELTDPKTDLSRRTIPLTPQAKDALRQQLERQLTEKEHAGKLYQDHGLIFATGLGTPLNLNTEVPRHFKAVLNVAKLPDMRLYDLRHSCATALLRAEANAKVVQLTLGHARVQTTLDAYIPNNSDLIGPSMKAVAERRAAAAAKLASER